MLFTLAPCDLLPDLPLRLLLLLGALFFLGQTASTHYSTRHSLSTLAILKNPSSTHSVPQELATLQNLTPPSCPHPTILTAWCPTTRLEDRFVF